MASPGADNDFDAPPNDIYFHLRSQVLDLDPASVGLAATPGTSSVWGAVMDTGYPNGTATLVCLRDGTTSMYTSSGGGLIGAGSHESVVRATREFLAAVTSLAGDMTPSTDQSLPASGDVIIRALTYDGPRVAAAAEDDLGYERSPFSPAFFAAHDVLTELRRIDEQRQ